MCTVVRPSLKNYPPALRVLVLPTHYTVHTTVTTYLPCTYILLGGTKERPQYPNPWSLGPLAGPNLMYVHTYIM